jgi:NTP pyrophosphatase (non-canonical NTP hydrolase)
MMFREYQDQALRTRQTPQKPVPDPVIVPLLGLAGEVGELLSEYKKSLRDGDAHKMFTERVAEELGDLLWYITDVADRYGLDLEDVARQNLAKCKERWGISRDTNDAQFDAIYPDGERFPRRFAITLRTVKSEGKIKMQMLMNGKQLGDDLTDNAYDDDGYRFHDVFHLAGAAVLGWSPVTRKLLGVKRKSNPRVDEVEDGGRATAIEEGISALVFSYAQNHAFLEDVHSLDYDLLRTITGMTQHLEVSACTPSQWERMILAAYAVWRPLKGQGGGTVVLDLYQRTIVLA